MSLARFSGMVGVFLLLLLPMLATAAPPDTPPGQVLVGYVSRVGQVDQVNGLSIHEMFVGATEYAPGDPGKVFVTLQKEGVPQNNASCITEAFYPNGTLFYPYTEMQFLDDGIYYHDFTVADTLGVYPVIVKCTYITYEEVRPVYNATHTAGVSTGTVTEVQTSDNLYKRFDESAATFRRIGGYFEAGNFSVGNVSVQAISLEVEVRRPIKGGDPAGDLLTWHLYNFSSGRWVPVGTTAYPATDTAQTFTVLSGAVNFINATGQVRVFFNDTLNNTATDGGDTDTFVDVVRVDVDSYLSNSTVETIAGGGEIHVREITAVCEVDSASLTIDPFTFLALLYAALLLGFALIKAPEYGLFVGAYGVFFAFLAWTPVGKWMTFLVLGVSFIILINSGRKL